MRLPAFATLLLVCVVGPRASAQTVRDVATDGVSTAQLQNYLFGAGVSVEDWATTGNAAQFGIFDDAPSSIVPFSKGLVVSSGAVKSLGTINTTDGLGGGQYGGLGDSEFGADTFDAATIQISIIPEGDTLFMDFVFGSEEYTEFVGNVYTDRMRLFVNGSNCALLPGTSTEVAIDTVNDITGSAYFINNDRFTTPTLTPTYPTQMDGFTTPLRCSATVTPDIPNTIKLGIVDVVDDDYDSWLLIKYRSFNTDRDGDGIPDSIETGAGSDPNDPCSPSVLTPMCTSGDADADGKPNVLECPDETNCANSDGTGAPNWNDDDSDDDGIPDATDVAYTDACLPSSAPLSCATSDADGDGTLNGSDPQPTDPCAPSALVPVCASGDRDGDGIANGVECPVPAACTNSDGTGPPDYNDTDSDDDGMLDANDPGSDRTDPCVPSGSVVACASGDTDRDGIDNGTDIDPSDACAPSDTVAACATGDTDSDGVLNSVECPNPGACINTDGTASPDFDDLDSDDDGVADDLDGARTDPCLPDPLAATCPTADSDHDGIVDDSDSAPLDPCTPSALTVYCSSGDVDGDMVDNATECPSPPACPNTDASDGPDYDDTDSDDDGTLDSAETSARTDPCAPDEQALACTNGDFDRDGAPNNVDPEPSDPCAPSTLGAVCPAGDTDADGITNAQECPIPSGCPDTDHDGNADFEDDDSDDDGAPDTTDTAPTDPCVPDAQVIACSAADSDHDGTPNSADSAPADPCDPNTSAAYCSSGDADGDGLTNGAECPLPGSGCPNSDGRGNPDYDDTDSDDDGALDAVDPTPTDPCAPMPDALRCASGDHDFDGTSNGTDTAPSDACAPSSSNGHCATGDSDGDGILNGVECTDPDDCADSDGDHIPDLDDTDADDDGVSDAEDEARLDPCVPDAYALVCPSPDPNPDPDLDSDHDGTPDIEDVEPNDPCTPSGAVAVCASGDADDDGIDNAEECPDSGQCVDSDADGMPDFNDRDSDGDGADDAVDRLRVDACGPDANAARCPSGDSDHDGIPNGVDPFATDPCQPSAAACAPAIEPDRDDDGVPDRIECGNAEGGRCSADTDGDGVLDVDDLDSDGDGIPDALECPRGAACPDSDGDGIPDILEQGAILAGGGGGCAVAEGRGDLTLLACIALAAWIIQRRRRQPHVPRRWCGFPSSSPFRSLALLIGWATLVPGLARAQAFQLQRFTPAPLAADGLRISGADTPGHLGYAAQLYLDYASTPLDVRLATGQYYDVVSSQLTLHAGGALGLGQRTLLFAGLPVNAWMDGDDPPSGILTRLPPADGAGLGDAFLGGRVRLLGDADAGPALSLQATLALPLARAARGTAHYLGDRGVSFEPQALFQARLGQLSLRANAGVRLRNSVTVTTVELGDELTYGLGLEYTLMQERLGLLAESSGATALRSFGDDKASPLELLLGLKYRSPGGPYAALGAGTGLISGIGTPAVRLLAAFGISAPSRSRHTDEESLLDPDDRCPAEPEDLDGFEDQDGCPDPDNDRDGLLDRSDRCPYRPEDRDGFEDQDGCPDPDNDRDGLLDPSDRCPSDAEDRDGVEDEDGCPDVDDDHDGVPNSSDKCKLDAEDRDGFADDDGCPDPDNDFDGLLDAVDPCPLESGSEGAGGCGDVHIDIAQGVIRVAQPIEFAQGRSTLLPSSEAILRKLQQALAANPQIKRVRIENHTDKTGPGDRNRELSRRRAQIIARWLLQAGITPDRLEPVGCGESRPLDPSGTPDANQRNRRTEFHLVDPAPPTSSPAPECDPVPFEDPSSSPASPP